MAVIGTLVFAGAMALSLTMIVLAVGPQWRRIMRLASGETETSFAPLQQLALAERRIAVRRWATLSVPSLRQMREVA